MTGGQGSPLAYWEFNRSISVYSEVNIVNLNVKHKIINSNSIRY